MQASAKGGAFDAPPAASPVRTDGNATALVLGGVAFPAMEELLLGAADRAWIALRALDPDTRLCSARSHELGLATWLDLLVHTAGRGIALRLFLTDFDPINAPDLNGWAWENARKLLARPDLVECENVDILLALHEGAVGTAWSTMLWPATRRRVARLVRLGRREELPGLEPFLTENGGVRRWPPAPIWPATHHQKIIAVDGTRAILGGLDIDERRCDTKKHDCQPDMTWHDVSVRVDGTVVADIEAHLVWLWNKECARYTGADPFHADLPSPMARRPRACHPSSCHPSSAHALAPPAPTGSTAIRFLRTLSRRTGNPRALVTEPLATENREAALALIRSARTLIYIENQFLRDRAVGEALTDQLRANPGLELIALVPMAPDEVAFQNDRSIDKRYGEWLTVRLVDGLLATDSKRVGVFALAGAERPRRDTGERDQVHHQGMVYVHAKVMIVDDRAAIISSSNLNGRSLEMDTEAGLLIENAGFARRLREELWGHHLGDLARHEPRLSVAEWRRVAKRNLAGKDPKDQIFIVPYPLEKARRFSRWAPYIPDRYV